MPNSTSSASALLLAAVAVAGSIGLTACGGSGGGSPSTTDTAVAPVAGSGNNNGTGAIPPPAPSPSPSPLPSPSPSPAPLPAPSPLPVMTQMPLAMPEAIANGSTVSLQCGKSYYGTLDLRGKSNVTVRTEGTCGKAILSPGQAIAGWSHYQGNIYSAPIGFEPVQLALDGQPQALAHWPSRAQTWAKAAGSTATSLSYAMPNADLVGATLIFRPFDWTIEGRKITAYGNNSMTLASTGNGNFDGRALSGTPDFYVEGKLWMLDEPGEWVASGGRVYVWTPDGQSPEGRVWASPDRHGIDAANSSGIVIDNVAIYGAADGIHAAGARDLRATRVDISNSSGNGIMNSGGLRLAVDGATIRNSRFDGIIVKWGGGGEAIANSRIDASAVIGMPVAGHAGISLTATDGARITDNVVSNSGYIGIRAFRNATIARNTVDTACVVLTDCGGIYVSAPDKLALNTRIEGNTVSNVGRSQRLAWALYLDSSANATTVSGNIVSASGNGMLIHNGFNNTVTGNWFSTSTKAHVQMAEGGSASVRNNVVTGNSFSARNGEETYRLSSDLGVSSVAQFASYDRNSYTSSSAVFANFNGESIGYALWKSRTGQDGASSFAVP